MNFHQKALLVGGITFFLCTGVILWTFVIDKGTISFTGGNDYSVEISGARLKAPQKISCSSDPCTVRLLSGTYEVVATKEGFLDEKFQTTVKLQNTTTVEIEFEYIPTLREAEDAASLEHLFTAENALSDAKFEMDPTYKKQKLVSADTVLAYFDRELLNPVAYESKTGRYVLVTDQGEKTTLYLVDIQESSRSYLGELSGLTTLKWSLDDSKLLIAEGNVLWIVDTATADFKEWAFEFSLEKAVWGNNLTIYFATNKNLVEFLQKDPTGTVDVLKNLLNGEYSEIESVAFSIGSYDVQNNEYRLLYEVPTTQEISYEKVRLVYDKEADKLYFSDGERAFEVVRSAN